MGQITLAVTLNERAYRTLARRAAAQHKTIGDLTSDLVNDWVAEWSELADTVETRPQAPTWDDEIERIRALPLEERRELARQACGTLKLPDGITAAQFVRQLRDEDWAEVEARIDAQNARAREVGHA
jgi:hypothetical protein